MHKRLHRSRQLSVKTRLGSRVRIGATMIRARRLCDVKLFCCIRSFQCVFFFEKSVLYVLQCSQFQFLPARRYASAGTIYGPVSVCVCLAQAGVMSKRMNESGRFLAWQLPCTCRPLCYKEVRVPSTIRVLPSGTLLQTLDLEVRTFASAYRSSKRVINFARERWTIRA